MASERSKRKKSTATVESSPAHEKQPPTKKTKQDASIATDEHIQNVSITSTEDLVKAIHTNSIDLATKINILRSLLEGKKR